MSAFVIRSLILIAWAGSLFGAFHFGKKLEIPISGGAPNSQKAGNAVTFAPSGKSTPNAPKASGNLDSTGEAGSLRKKNNVNVPDLITSMKAQFQSGGGMMYNASAMMKIMAPIADLSVEQIREALVEIENSVKNSQQKMIFNQLLLGRLAEIDGKGAMEFVTEKYSGRGGMAASMSMSVMGTWAQRDPEGAWNWFVENRKEAPSGQMGNNQIQFIFSGLAARDLGNAFRRLDELDDFEKNMAVSGIAMSASWDPDSRDELLSLSKDLPTEQKDQLYQRLFSQWAMATPEEAIDWAQQLPEEDRKKIAHQGGYSLLYADPKLGAEFMLENSSEADLPRTYRMIASQWANIDPNAAGEWLNQLPQGPHLDDARSNFARTISPRDPISAMEWAKTVETENKRKAAIRQVYTQWHGKSPQEADSALDSSGMSDEEIAKIREAAAKAKPNRP